jgi:hypothetical protein
MSTHAFDQLWTVCFFRQFDLVQQGFEFLLILGAMETFVIAASLQVWELSLRGIDHRHRLPPIFMRIFYHKLLFFIFIIYCRLSMANRIEPFPAINFEPEKISQKPPAKPEA